MLSDPGDAARYDAFGPDFRQVPDGRRPRDAGRGRSAAPARAPEDGGAGRRGRRCLGLPGSSATTSTSTTCSAACSGGGGAPGVGAGSPGADQEAELELSVEDAYRGGRRTITLPGRNGPRTLEVTIPAGVTDGQRIRLAGQGGQGSGGGRRPAISTWSFAWPRIPATGSTAATSTWTCRCARGRRRSAPRSPSRHPGARPRCGCRPGRRAGAAAAAGPRPAQPQRDARGPVRRGRDHGAAVTHRRGAPAVRGARRRRRPSTRGGRR